MEMDKLKSYNQKLIAIIGTTIVGLAIIFLILGLIALITNFTGLGNENNSGIQVRNNPAERDSTIIRTQQITFYNPIQLDTAKTNFLIPVGQVNLENDEKIRIRSGRGLEFSSSEYRFNSYYGLYNNFIFFEYKLQKKTKIFSQKVAITNWANIKANGIELLLFEGAGVDSNNDGLINTDDYQSLYAFYLSDKKLVEYKLEKETVISFDPMNKTDLISVIVGVDKNEDFNFDHISEPQEILILNIRSRKLENLISREMNDEIQGTIDN